MSLLQYLLSFWKLAFLVILNTFVHLPEHKVTLQTSYKQLVKTTRKASFPAFSFEAFYSAMTLDRVVKDLI